MHISESRGPWHMEKEEEQEGEEGREDDYYRREPGKKQERGDQEEGEGCQILRFSTGTVQTHIVPTRGRSRSGRRTGTRKRVVRMLSKCFVTAVWYISSYFGVSSFFRRLAQMETGGGRYRRMGGKEDGRMPFHPPTCPLSTRVETYCMVNGSAGATES